MPFGAQVLNFDIFIHELVNSTMPSSSPTLNFGICVPKPVSSTRIGLNGLRRSPCIDVECQLYIDVDPTYEPTCSVALLSLKPPPFPLWVDHDFLSARSDECS
jgi:hypothetical protein